MTIFLHTSGGAFQMDARVKGFGKYKNASILDLLSQAVGSIQIQLTGHDRLNGVPSIKHAIICYYYYCALHRRIKSTVIVRNFQVNPYMKLSVRAGLVPHQLLIENLSKVYFSSMGKVVSLRNISFTVNKGKFVSVVGRKIHTLEYDRCLNMIGA